METHSQITYSRSPANGASAFPYQNYSDRIFRRGTLRRQKNR